MDRFILQERRWYSVEFIGDTFTGQDPMRYSPIRIESIQPMNSGNRLFKLTFYHANYHQGVQEKTYTLETIERGETFILAKSAYQGPTRILHIFDIDWKWIQNHFPHLFTRQFEKNCSIENFLNRNC